MRLNKYINTDAARNSRLSRIACGLLLPLILLSNKDNEINKKKFIKSVKWMTDYRTWNKYWKELVDMDVLIHLDKNMWMVSPHECFSEGVSHAVLIHKWNEACNATTN